jgi:ssDNA-binding replication factor A large subunit
VRGPHFPFTAFLDEYLGNARPVVIDSRAAYGRHATFRIVLRDGDFSRHQRDDGDVFRPDRYGLEFLRRNVRTDFIEQAAARLSSMI